MILNAKLNHVVRYGRTMVTLYAPPHSWAGHKKGTIFGGIQILIRDIRTYETISNLSNWYFILPLEVYQDYK